MNTNKKQRDSNIELFRIFLMLTIIAGHYVVNSGLRDVMNENFSSPRTFFYYIFGYGGKIGINCFVLVTGYFMCKSNITIRKFLKLLLEVEFYRIVIFLIFVISGYETLSAKTIYYAVWPLRKISNEFTPAFLLFFLFIPFLNILIRNMEKKTHGRLILLCLFIYTLLGSIPKITFEWNYVSWFCILYFVASYIRLYDIPHKNSTKYWLRMTFLFWIAFVVTTILIIWINKRYHIKIDPWYLVMDSNKLLALLIAISAFNLFRNIHLPYNKFINWIAQSTFGVFLIHANSDAMRQWLWKDTLNVANQFHSDFFIIHAILSVLCVYFICVLIDRIRILFIEKPVFSILDRWLTKKSRLFSN